MEPRISKKKLQSFSTDTPTSKRHTTTVKLRAIFEVTDKIRAENQMNKWTSESRTIGIKEFNSTANTIQNNKSNILNFFNT
ncbi:MAG: transposase [Flavobacteriales bacterium]|nr:transposase [Flavobacteriales bacterium]